MVHDCRYLYFHIICPGAVRRIVIIDDSSVHSDMTIYYRHGLRAATRIGPFLASFGLLSPSLLGSKAPVSIGPFHMTFPPRDLTVFVESLTNLDEKGERALEMYRNCTYQVVHTVSCPRTANRCHSSCKFRGFEV